MSLKGGWKRRKFWGVAMDGGVTDRPMLLGDGWHKGRSYDLQTCAHLGQAPTRAMLFLSRAQAREWCAGENARYQAYPDGHICRSWRFRPVRVVESVRVIK